jgi:hypothetical protein
MVFYSKTSIQNLSEILIGLINWPKHPLSKEHAEKYVSEIRSICDALDRKIFHFNTKYALHKSFGNKVYTYRKSKQTSWYIIYNIDSHRNVYIQRILSNHTTTNEQNTDF